MLMILTKTNIHNIYFPSVSNIYNLNALKTKANSKTLRITCDQSTCNKTHLIHLHFSLTFTHQDSGSLHICKLIIVVLGHVKVFMYRPNSYYEANHFTVGIASAKKHVFCC